MRDAHDEHDRIRQVKPAELQNNYSANDAFNFEFNAAHPDL